MSGILYVLDEPSIGLHERDNQKLIYILKELRDLENTVVVVEHDATIIREADWVVDMGPGAGRHGGMVVAEGGPKEIIKNKGSLTGDYLSGRKNIEIPKIRRKGNGKKITIKEASEFNLKKIDIDIPLGTMVCIMVFPVQASDIGGGYLSKFTGIL